MKGRTGKERQNDTDWMDHGKTQSRKWIPRKKKTMTKNGHSDIMAIGRANEENHKSQKKKKRIMME